MLLPYDDIVSASGSLDRAVLLSEKTQLIAIKALQIAELRANWSEMTDSEWDTLEDVIGEAYTEILTISESETVPTFSEVARITSTQAIATGGVLVQWNSGVSYDSGNNTMLVPALGWNIISASVLVTSGASFAVNLQVLKNGNEINRVNASGLATHYIGCAFSDYVNEFDHYEVVLLVSAAATLQVSYRPFLQALSVGG